MSLRMTQGQVDRVLIRQRLRKEAAERAASAREATHSGKLVALWNSRAERGARPSFFPTVATAVNAGAPWLQAQCPGCQTVGDVDLRRLGRHPDASIQTLIPMLSCMRCCPNPPFARLVRLSDAPIAGSNLRLKTKRR